MCFISCVAIRWRMICAVELQIKVCENKTEGNRRNNEVFVETLQRAEIAATCGSATEIFYGSRSIPPVAASHPRSKRDTPFLLLAHYGPGGGVARVGAGGTIGERISFFEKHDDRSVCAALVRPGV
jgi:hypothetical protein